VTAILILLMLDAAEVAVIVPSLRD